MVETTNTVTSTSPEETMRFGRDLAAGLRGGDVLALYGPLGAGKTTLIKGIAEGLCVGDPAEVRSPTFVLVRVYDGRTSEGAPVSIHHVDAYRLTDGADFDDMGGIDLFGESSVCIIEWADRIAAALPAKRTDITLEHVDPKTRKITTSR
jgi:tRNA threonylcarbamoyladenosine biosynthesis protein TsaE